ncbi:MAG: hypothetical protein KF893_02800 [Caldilineaceae bacterium]|nr:hypothetical protein [Caldilineaceae bacterium]
MSLEQIIAPMLHFPSAHQIKPVESMTNTVYSPTDHIHIERRFSAVYAFVAVIVSALLAVFPTTRLSITADLRMMLQPWLLNQSFVPYLQIADERSPLHL